MTTNSFCEAMPFMFVSTPIVWGGWQKNPIHYNPDKKNSASTACAGENTQN